MLLLLVGALVVVVLVVVLVAVLAVVLAGSKSIEDLCEKFSQHIKTHITFQKTAARTLCFLSGAVSGTRWSGIRPGRATEKEPQIATLCLGKKSVNLREMSGKSFVFSSCSFSWCV